MSIDLTPLPNFADVRSILRDALPALRPAEEISVTAAAERDMRVNVGGQWQAFRRDVTPYMVEPADMTASRAYKVVAFAGPSQSGKTKMLETALAYTIGSDPARVALFQMSRDKAREYELDKLAPMLRNSPNLAARKATGRGADTQFQKLFSGGTHLTLDWPTITKLSSSTIRLVLGTDFDHFGDSVDGEGDPLTLMRARTRTFMSRGMVVVESSPGAPIRDENWRAQTLHDSPPVAYGILAVYPQGTRGRWYWPCPHECGEEFEPTLARLRYPDSADPVEAGEAAQMMCPGCGALFEHTLKTELNGAGRWLHETQDGKRAVPLGDAEMRRSDVLSYWLNGAAAAFSTWAELVTQERAAIRHFELTGDEGQLQAAYNTGQGIPYLPRAAGTDSEISLQGLRDKAQDTKTPKGVAPSWARYITVSVDTQGNRWDVGVIAWGEGGLHQPIDRFDVHQPPADAPNAGDRTVRPFDVPEDWAALAEIEDMCWPVEGGEYALKAKAIAVDMQGGGGSVPNAYAFYRGRKRVGAGQRWFLTRGIGRTTRPDRVWFEAPERARGGRKVATDLKILNMATNPLKDAVSASLRVREVGQNVCLIPGWVEEAHLLELTAERRTVKGWEKRAGMVRNEAFDHLVQARALHIQIRAERINWTQPPEWAVGGPQNAFAVGEGAKPDEANEGASTQSQQQAAPASDGWIRQRGKWI
ncbi:MAG: terminase gpA endonuclease subunit [Pseudomonadota bacterium]